MTSQTKPTITITTSQFVDGAGNTIDAADFTIPFGEVEDLLDFLGRLSVTASDTNIKHLDDALSDGGDITFTVVSGGGDEQIQATIKAGAVGSAEIATNAVGASELQSTIAQAQTFNSVTAGGTIQINVPSGGRDFDSQRGGTTIWRMAFGNGTTDDDLVFTCFNDAGSLIGFPLIVRRLTQNIETAANLSVGGALSKGSGTFEIAHQTREGYSLRHEMIEGPRADLIYRGRATLSGGTATVDLDAECNETGGMSAGTFEWLTQNPQVFVSNNETWDMVRGSVSGATLTIECENASSSATVEWMVVAERADEVIKAAEYTDADGRVICEHQNPALDMDEVEAMMDMVKAEKPDGTPKEPAALKEERLRVWKEAVRGKGKYPIRGKIVHPQTGKPVEVKPPMRGK